MTEPDLEALEQAARPVRERIRRDTATAPPALAKILAALQERLFEPRLTIRAVLEACQLRDRFLPVRFHETLGLPPAQYLRIARLEVACRLLRDTELSVARIAELVGYERPDSLSDALAAWEGLRPTRLRPLLRKQARAGRQRTAVSDIVAGPPGSLRQRLMAGQFVGGLSDTCDLRLGLIPAEDLQALTTHLRTLGSCNDLPEPDRSEACPDTPPGDVAWSRLDSTFAAELWAEAELLPESERRAYLLHFHFTTPALFWLLSRKSREMGREGRHHGVSLAELALESLERVAWDTRPSGERQRLESLGWAWLGHAHCAAFELVEAQAALEKAESLAPPEAEGEVGLIRARLLWYQRRIPEAVAHLEKAVARLRRLGPRRALAQALALAGAVAYSRGRSVEALAPLAEAASLAKALGDDYLQLSAIQAQAVMLVDLKRWEDAAEPLTEARALQSRIGGKEGALQITWLEGLLALGRGQADRACRMLAEAQSGFVDSGLPGYAALAALDLALAWHSLEQSERVLIAARDALALLKSLRNNSEILPAAALLRAAVAKGALSRSVLDRSRQDLARAMNPHRCAA